MLMMLPFEAPTIFEGIHKSYFRMPRVVKDQRGRFENDDLFRQLSHESAVKYIGFKDRPLGERQNQFITDCYLGHTEVSVVQSGNQFTLMFTPTANPAYDHEGCYIDKEQGKAHIKAGFILNGVCVLWRGWIDLQRLEGFGCLEFDEYRAYLEDAMAKQQSDGKQPMCNTNLNSQAAPPAATALGHLNHLAGPTGPPPPPPPGAINHAAAAIAAAATTQSMLPPPPVGLNSSCLSAGSALTNGNGLMGPPPPVSLAESAAYGNAAIAAAAAAAFHQALSAGNPGGVPPSLNGLHGVGLAPPPPHTLVGPPPPQHLAAAAAYTQNGSPPHHNPQTTSPPHHTFNANNGHSQTSQRTSTKSPPERENQQHHNHNHHHQQQHQSNNQKRPSKRHHDDSAGQTVDEVDVVSDISAHELDFPPRRIFKSESAGGGGGGGGGHHQAHKISRRAAS